jgi:hypothetical protein
VKRLTVVLLTLLLGLAVPTLATAQLGPTAIPAPLTQTNPSDTAPAPVEDTGGISTLQLVLIFGAAIVVIGIIAFVIVRDAHRAAPAPSRAGAGDPKLAPRKSAREREREQARKRNKAKAARNQRKRNRPR